MTEIKLCRSALYMPAINARAIAKSRTLPCDCVILDLEDAVAPERKRDARQAALAALAEGGFAPKLVVIRANGLETEWGEADLIACATAGADAVLLPKVETVESLVRVRAVLDKAGARAMLPLWAMIETPRAIVNAPALAALPGLEAFVLGVNDLALGLRVPSGEASPTIELSLALAVLAARAEGKLVLDGVYNDIADSVGFAASCETARRLGFDGKSLIHPSQIEAANRAFAPSEAAIAEARGIVAAFEAPEAQGKGVIAYQGRMVERLHLAEAQRLLGTLERLTIG